MFIFNSNGIDWGFTQLAQINKWHSIFRDTCPCNLAVRIGCFMANHISEQGLLTSGVILMLR